MFKTMSNNNFALKKRNYQLIAIGIAIIIFGFILMSGSANEDPSHFNEDIFSFRRITLAPIIVLFGFILEIYAILKKF